jgi:hypothetical protein
MSSCARRFWGTGIPCTRPDMTSERSKEMNMKLADLIAARNQQDQGFGGGVAARQQEQKTTLEIKFKPPNK